MPLVKMYIREGKTGEYKNALLEGVRRALVNAVRIPESDRNQMLFELPPDGFSSSAGKTEESTVIEIIIFKGRSLEVKRALYKEIVECLSESPDIMDTDILIVLHEPPLENWGIRGGIPASEVDLGFKVDI